MGSQRANQSSFDFDEVVDHRESPASEAAERKELREAVEKVLASLTKREQKILGLRFALTDGNIYSIEEAATIVKHSRQWVRGVETLGLAKLRSPMRLQRLGRFINE